MDITSRSEFTRLMINRRNLYHLIGRLFQKEVDELLFHSLRTIAFPSHREENELTEFRDALIRLEDYFTYDAGESLDDLATDFAKTFLGAGIAQGAAAFPYESVYTSPRGIMMQDAWSEMCALLEDKGIERNEESDELLEDHISIQMDFMAYLCDETNEFTETLTGLEEQKAFLNSHILNWVPKFCLDIKEHADTEFYRMVGQFTTGFLQLDGFILDQMINIRKASIPVSQGHLVSHREADQILKALAHQYHIYGPVFTDLDHQNEKGPTVDYQEITSVKEIVTDRQSHFSMKKIVYPISQAIFSFDEHQCKENYHSDPKGIIVFARPCDVNGLRRLDNMFLSNGGSSDLYYKRLREKVKFFLLSCGDGTGYDDCFCATMGSNVTDQYSIAWDIGADQVRLEVKDWKFLSYFEGLPTIEYTPTFVTKNKKEVNIPNITPNHNIRDIYNLEMWKECSEDCISCGGCNTVCPTCSCFDTIDVLNQENSRKGERRRIWASCMLADYSKTAGGHTARPRPDQMMRFKTMHKVYDYKNRFGGSDHMCVGCGRCDIRCPKDISFANTINSLSKAVDEMPQQEQEA